VPARFYVFVSLAIVHFAARGVDFLLGKLSRPAKRAAVAAGLALVLAVELAPRPVHWVPLEREEQFPAIYRWIAKEPSVKALIELPIYDSARENLYIYYSTLHWKPLANGFSGYFPESHALLTEHIHFLPDEDGFRLLRQMWISHLVVHAEGPRREALLRAWEAHFAAGENRQVEPVYRSGRISVYRLLEPASSRTPKRAGL
jgi:hypothetical protein